jgi:hypothetical protein
MVAKDLPLIEPASAWNHPCFDPHSTRGHYESFFLRANHPSRPLAFWIRYTIFSPKGQPEGALGQLWAIFFGGETGRIVAVKEGWPISECSFQPGAFAVRIGGSRLDSCSLTGHASSAGHSIHWSLDYGGNQPPLLLLTPESYTRGFPSAKAVVSLPLATYTGALTIDGENQPVDGWVGSQNHNWGRRHTDQYAWGQVAGFDDAPEAFLECITARLKLGPLWTPRLTSLVLRLGDRQYSLNSIPQALRAHGRYEYFTWTFDSSTPEVRISGKIEASRDQFVGLKYENPPGGAKICLNTKIASCQARVELPGKSPIEMSARWRAAFEILTEDDQHGVPVVA